MIEHLKGTLTSKTATFVVVEVGGLGFGVAISLNTWEKLSEVGCEVRLLTHLHVREDRLELFGFVDPQERELFRLLIGVSGIGTHLAQTILSGMSLEGLQDAVFHGRVDELIAVKGIGRKTAERMVLELRDKVRLPPAGMEREQPGRDESGNVEEAILALTALGIAVAAARQAVGKVVQKGGTTQSVPELIKQALKQR
jgi:holliday junction DNA helicase RuvA